MYVETETLQQEIVPLIRTFMNRTRRLIGDHAFVKVASFTGLLYEVLMKLTELLCRCLMCINTSTTAELLVSLLQD